MRKKINFALLMISLLYAATQPALAQSQYPLTITTSAVPPVNSYLNRVLTISGTGVHVMIRNDSQSPVTFKFWGKVERIAPSPLSFETKLDYVMQSGFYKTLQPKEVLYVTTNMLKEAFADFREDDLSISGISSLEELKDGLNYKLPEGQYQLCIYARRFDVQNHELGGDVANPLAGCATFSVCTLTAPQFTQPVNNFNVNSFITTVKPASPVVFTWTPPLATCTVPMGSFKYDLEIREILDNQSISDVINNPYIFHKSMLPSATFLLDTNLYKSVLQPGKKYAIRVQASMNNNSVNEVENNGYSRIEEFQYGADYAEDQVRSAGAESYLIPAELRKIDFWDNVFSAYANHTRGDTIVPIKEYIAVSLGESGIAYNQDAIDMFLALNPDIENAEKVKLSYNVKLPDFAKVSDQDRRLFDKQYETDLMPDANEENLFKKYIDSLQMIMSSGKARASDMLLLNNLISHLNAFKIQVAGVNRVSVSLINQLLSKLLFTLWSNSVEVLNTKENKLQNIVSAISDLTSETATGAWLNNNFGAAFKALLCYNEPGRRHIVNEQYASEAGQAAKFFYLPSFKQQLLPFDIVVWRYSKELTSKPVTDAPDLAGTYRIFYTVSALYNARNPEINAKSSSHLASTAAVSLPPGSSYQLWAISMLDHHLIKPQKIEINDLFLLNNKRNNTTGKNYRIILKVE